VKPDAIQVEMEIIRMEREVLRERGRQTKAGPPVASLTERPPPDVLAEGGRSI